MPGLMAATGMTLAHAAASSLVSVSLFGAATSVSYAASGLIDWGLFAALVVGGAGGTAAGAPLARALADRTDLARRGFALMVIATAAYVAWRALTRRRSRPRYGWRRTHDTLELSLRFRWLDLADNNHPGVSKRHVGP